MGKYSDEMFNNPNNLLIADQLNNRVVEIDITGKIVWSFGNGPPDLTVNSIIGVNDAQRIDDLTLMAGSNSSDNRVILVDPEGKIIWQYGQFGQSGNGPNLLNVPVYCSFVKNKMRKYDSSYSMNGTILITDQGNNRVIEVDENKNIILELSTQLSSPSSAEKLRNMNILIADKNNNRAIEMTPAGTIINVYTGGGLLGNCSHATRLRNDNVLLTDSSNNCVMEVDPTDTVVWIYYLNKEYNSILVSKPSRAFRLHNGNTLITDQLNNRVIVVSESSVIVESYGLPLALGANTGYDTDTVQRGLHFPCDAKIIRDRR